MASSSESLPHQRKAEQLKAVFALNSDFENWYYTEGKRSTYVRREHSTNIELLFERNPASPNQEQPIQLISKIETTLNAMDGPVTKRFPYVLTHKKLRGSNAKYKIYLGTRSRVSLTITSL